jgi:hypothetical protein
MKKFAAQIAAAALALGFVAAAGAWEGPTQPAPQGNVPAPINVGALAQSKSGSLGVGGLGVFGRGFFSSAPDYSLAAPLTLGVNGAVGASQYCDQNGQNCVTTIGAASSTAVSGGQNLVYINPDSTDFAPLECVRGVNYLIDPITFSATSATTYTTKKLALLKPGSWRLTGTGFLRNRNRSSDHAQTLRVSTVLDGAVTHLLNNTIDEGFYTNSVSGSLSVPSAKTMEIQVSIRNNRLNGGSVVVWCVS